MNRIAVGALVVGALIAAGGCASDPVHFDRCSTPYPPEGYYTIIGKPVTGTSTQYRILGIGGDVSSSQQFNALEDAMSKTDNADALISMTIDRQYCWPLYIPFIFQAEIMRVTGIPVKFSKK